MTFKNHDTLAYYKSFKQKYLTLISKTNLLTFHSNSRVPYGVVLRRVSSRLGLSRPTLQCGSSDQYAK